MRFFEAKAYGLQDAGNPLFPRKESFRKFWVIAGVAIAIVSTIVGLSMLVYGPYLRFQSIDVTGTVTLSTDELAMTVRQELATKNYWILPNDHRWFFDKSHTEIVLKDSFPLKSATIVKDGATLKVEVVEDVFMIAFRSGDLVYFLDPNGVIIREATPEEKATVLVRLGEVPAPAEGERGLAVLQTDTPVIREKTAIDHVVGDQVFNDVMIENIIQFGDGLRSLGTLPKEFVSENVELPWFAITSNKAYLILFDALENVDTQLTVLKTVTDEYFATQESPHYIDVRFGNRVYVR